MYADQELTDVSQSVLSLFICSQGLLRLLICINIKMNSLWEGGFQNAGQLIHYKYISEEFTRRFSTMDWCVFVAATATSAAAAAAAGAAAAGPPTAGAAVAAGPASAGPAAAGGRSAAPRTAPESGPGHAASSSTAAPGEQPIRADSDRLTTEEPNGTRDSGFQIT